MTQWAATETTEIVDEPGSFDTLGVWDMIAPLLEARVSLPKHPGQRDGTSRGPSMVIEPTQALVAVDINTGDSFSRSSGLETNLLAIGDLPRLLRLRGLGGQIVIDPAPMAKRHRSRIRDAIKEAFEHDPIDTAFVGWTPLGHVELQRKRTRVPLDALALDEFMTVSGI